MVADGERRGGDKTTEDQKSEMAEGGVPVDCANAREGEQRPCIRWRWESDR